MEEENGRHEFQQFKTKETERTKGERRLVDRKKVDPIRIAKYVWRVQERVFELVVESEVNRGRTEGQ